MGIDYTAGSVIKLANPQRAAAIAEFGGLKFEDAGRKILNLLEIQIDLLRKDNDTAKGEEVLWNQGEIRGLIRLKSYLEREKK
jgi:hypothetical protein